MTIEEPADVASLYPEPISAETMHRLVALIPGDNGWWRKAGLAQYRTLADNLVESGYQPGEALAFLQTAFGAAVAEFGGS